MNQSNKEEDNPFRWTRYNAMMASREAVDFSNPSFCAKCGKRWGDHLSEAGFKINPRACKFQRK